MASDPQSRATAYWTVAPGRGELREQLLAPPGPGEALVRALHSGISRGTELLVHRGGVPPAVAARMRAPFQEGDLPGPVKYGYLSVGIVEAVEEAAAELLGRTVFCLYPHQDRYVVPTSALTVVPDGVPARRAVLAGTVETAVNAVWDAAPRLGDRIAVIGAGMVGAAVAGLLRTFPLNRLELVDVDERRRPVAEELGVSFVTPAEAAGDCDLVVHCSATSAGLSRGLELLGDEGELVELSWYGDKPVEVNLGADFHARRLSIRASQVGTVAAARRARRSYADRLELALDLLRDPAFDALISGNWRFAELPQMVHRLATGELNGLCHVVDYDAQPSMVHSRVQED
ncbi:MAG TPA: zinc-binding alcohol dehydrogenase [Kineosporiaceae bacterium]|nr:zinc-binding alcohol dehydrogenase [Kineosporiaceae bacterium]